ncbi:MAG: hypothetical protein JO328_07895 [Hyphomicrobiales bacterium]|nr:hypothetical protein [Hyphomicrobiales bacterium]MBV8826560.1 hypothetical protein [Hyphomicrobiales bacterium]MBV9430049.1 hypothetical protein [Bradyrhizobiaceae bacterium]
MKVTIDIPDGLWRDAQKLAMREGVTPSALIERGIRRVLSEAKPFKKPSNQPFKLRDGSFKGNGLRPELRDAPWSVIRALAYRD